MERSTLTAKEAAEFVGVSYWLLLELCKRKEIPHIKVGRRVLFRQETLHIWLQDRELSSVLTEVPPKDNYSSCKIRSLRKGASRP